MRISLLFTGLLALLLVIALGSCGTQNVGVLGNPDEHQAAGVKLGGYEVIRYNAVGVADPSLNGTLDLRLEGEALVVSVTDDSFTSNVLLDVKYDAGRVHPVKAEFHGLLGNSSQVLSAAFIEQVPGVASVGEVAIGSYVPGALSGDAATIEFAPGALHSVSVANDVYGGTGGTGVDYTVEPAAYAPGLDAFIPISTVPGEINLTWYSAWARADGTQDSICNIADLTPIGVGFGQTITIATFNQVPRDYSNDGIINIGDVTPLGAHFGERYDQFLVEASDNTTGAARTTVDTMLFADGVAAAPPATHPQLETIFRTWQVDFTGASAFTYAQLGALDTDADGNVRLWVTPQETGAPPASTGKEAFVDVPVVGGNAVEITGFDIQAVGATGGTGVNSDIFADAAVGNYVSNAACEFMLNSVSGTFNGDPFSAGSLGAMTQAQYDSVKADVATAMGWDFNVNTSDALARFTSFPSWVVLDNPFTGTGDPGTGVVCPDDDPESDTADPEGAIDCSLALGGITSSDPELSISVPAALDFSFGFDTNTDPEADIIEGYYSGTDFGTKVTHLVTDAGNSTLMFVNVPTWAADGSDLPDPANCQVELRVVNGKDASVPVTIPVDADDPPDNDPEVGEFYIFRAPSPLDINIFIIKVDGIDITAGNSYALRLFNGNAWSSVNIPTDLLLTEPGPPPEDLLTVPDVLNRTSVPAFIQIFRNEPNVRRDGRFVLDTINGTANPVDPAGYADVLKSNGTNFPVAFKEEIVGGNPVYVPYPKIVVKDTDDGAITGPTDPGAVPDITIPFDGGREACRIVADITMLVLNLPPGVPGGDPDRYNYQLFDANLGSVGTGDFELPQEPHDLTTPVGAAWGIDVGARGDWAKNDFNTLCTLKSVDGSTMTTPTPNVMWVRFNKNTRVLDWDEYWNPGGDVQQDNFQLVLEDEENNAQKMSLYLTIAGVTVQGDYIALHHFNLNDGSSYVDWVASFPNGGVLNPGHNYFVYLDDPTVGGYDYTFPDTLACIGNNPNFP